MAGRHFDEIYQLRLGRDPDQVPGWAS
jgi:hypothetical protein